MQGLKPRWQVDRCSNPPSTLGISPNAVPPLAPQPRTGPSMWCSPLCVHVFSLINSHLWVRTCGVWFSVLVIVCWEWWFPALCMSLQRTWTHPFLWLHSIPWGVCATFSLCSLSFMGIWVGPESLLLYYLGFMLKSGVDYWMKETLGPLYSCWKYLWILTHVDMWGNFSSSQILSILYL